MAASENPSPDILAEYVPLIAKGAGILFVGGLAGMALRYMFQVLVARELGVSLFGLFSLGLAFFSIADVTAGLGTSRGIVRYVALYQKERDPARIKGTLFMATRLCLTGGLIICFLSLAFSKPLAVRVFHSPQLSGVLYIFSLAIPFSCLGTMFISALQGLKIMKYKVYARDLSEAMGRIIGVLALFSLGWKLGGATTAFLMAVILSTGLSFWYFKRHFNAFFKEPVAPVYERKKFFAFCWPLFFADLFILTEAWISLFILGFFLSSEDVGIFSAAYKTTLLIQGILMSFNLMFSPIISGLHRSQEFEKIRTLFQIISRWVFSLSIPPILILIIFSKEILQLFGQSFVLGSRTLIILSLAQLLNSATGPLGGMIDMSGRTRITLLNALLNLLVHSVLCFFLIPRYGVLGAALARLTSVFLLRTARLIQVYIIWKMYPFRADFFKPLMAGAVSGLCLMFMKNALEDIFPSLLVLLSGILLFAGIYTAAVLVMGIPQEDKKVWEMVKKKLKGMNDIR